MGQILHCLCKGIEFIQSHGLEEIIPYFYNKCELGLSLHSWVQLRDHTFKILAVRFFNNSLKVFWKTR